MSPPREQGRKYPALVGAAGTNGFIIKYSEFSLTGATRLATLAL
jgi:hypothetical protein